MKNLKSGKVVENRFRSGEQVEIARVEFKEMQYLYEEGENIVVMDNETYEQVSVSPAMAQDALKWVVENMEVELM